MSDHPILFSAPDAAQIRADALREVLALVRGYLDAWDDTDINGSSISIIYDAIIALIDTPPAVSDDVAALVLAVGQYLGAMDAPNPTFTSQRMALFGLRAALAKLKVGS